MIVEIAFRLGDAKLSRQNRRGEIFRARLPVASSDGDYFQPERPTVIGSNLLVGVQRLARPNEHEIFRNIPVPVLINEGTSRARFCSGFDEIVSIEIFASQRDE